MSGNARFASGVDRPEGSKPRSSCGLKQLPAIPCCQQRRKHSQSTISTSKHLQGNDDYVRDEGEEDADFATTAAGRNLENYGRGSCSLSSSKDEAFGPDRKCAKKNAWPTFEISDPVVDGDIQAMIQRKADSLGLLSRKWAKNLLHGALANNCLTNRLEPNPLPHATGASSKRIGHAQAEQLPEEYLFQKLKGLESTYNTKSKPWKGNTSGIPSSVRHCEAESKNGCSSNKPERFIQPPTRSLTMPASLPKEKWTQRRTTSQSGRPKLMQRAPSRIMSSNGRPRKLQQPETYKWRTEGEKWGAEKVSQLKGILDIQRRAIINTEIS